MPEYDWNTDDFDSVDYEEYWEQYNSESQDEES